MSRADGVALRIKSIAQLREVVAAMRSLAAVRMQQAAMMLDGARRYGDIIGAALSQALTLNGGPASPPAGLPRLALLVFAPEHGFVGGYADALGEAVQAAAPNLVLMVGAKGAQTLTELGRVPDWGIAMASHAGALPEVAGRIADEVSRLAAQGAFSRADMLFGRTGEGGRWRIQRHPLLPADLSRFRKDGGTAPPLHHLAPADLLDKLVEEHVLSELMLAATEALAAENAARLQAMTTAGDNIERKLDELTGQERVLRQEQITEELLDVVTGAERLFREEGA